MEKEFNKNIRPILDVFDKIGEVLRFENIEIPKIVVVGDQSAGKSSVLESITGIKLPRGSGTVTKCPIVIQIRNVKDDSLEYATVRIEGEETFDKEKIPLKDLSQKINDTQNAILKRNASEISDVPLYVYVNKLNSPDLTLFDLPGLTYKNENITLKIKEIILKYTQGSETTILIVVPATVDLTTSEALSLIRQNNDYKERTYAVITKIDECKDDKNLLLKLMSNEMELKFPPICVRNRTQEELDNDESIECIKQKEIELFNSPNLSKLPEESKGIDQLIKLLVNIQKIKLIDSKEYIRDKIRNEILDLKFQDRSLPLPADTPREKIERFRECLEILVVKFSNSIQSSDIDVTKKIIIYHLD